MMSLTHTLLGLTRGDARGAAVFAQNALSSPGANHAISSALHLLAARAYLTLGDLDQADVHAKLFRASSRGMHADQFVQSILDAWLALGRGDATTALALTEAALKAPPIATPHGPYIPLGRVLHARALEACGQKEAARAAILEARAWLLQRADKVLDPALRRGFLENIPEHVEIMAMAERASPDPAVDTPHPAP